MSPPPALQLVVDHDDEEALPPELLAVIDALAETLARRDYAALCAAQETP